MNPTRNNMEFVQFEFPWFIGKDEFREMFKTSKPITQRFWTTHNNGVLEWCVELSPGQSRWVNFGLIFVDGPAENVRFQCSIFDRCPPAGSSMYSGHITMKAIGGNPVLSTEFRDKEFKHMNFAHIFMQNDVPFVRRIHLKVAAASFNLDIPSNRPEAQDSMIDLHKSIENADSKDSDVRLISGDGGTFYCHRRVLTAQSDVMDAMFRNAKTEKEKNGAFRLSAWTAEELRKILEYFYASKTDLESLSIEQLMNIYDFGEQHGLERFKKAVEMQMSKCAQEQPMDCAGIARFADLHLQNGLKRLKYCCYDVLAKNYSRLELGVDEIFKEASSEIEGEEPPSKKMRGSDEDTKKRDDVGIRLKNEFTKYLVGRIEGVMIE